MASQKCGNSSKKSQQQDHTRFKKRIATSILVERKMKTLRAVQIFIHNY